MSLVLPWSPPFVGTLAQFTVDTGGDGDYGSLSEFESNEQTNLTIDGINRMRVILVASDGTADTARVDFGGWGGMDDDHRLEIMGAVPVTGKWNPNAYRLQDSTTGGNSGLIRFLNGGGVSHPIVHDVQFQKDAGGVGIEFEQAVSKGVLFNSMFRRTSGTSWPCVSITLTGSNPLYMANLVGYGVSGGEWGSGINFSTASDGAIAFNCTMIGMPGDGCFFTHAAGIHKVINCVGLDGGPDFGVGAGDSFHADSRNNTSSDGTAPGNVSQTNAFVGFRDRDNEDFRIVTTSQAVVGSAVDLSQSPDFPFDYDIEGTTRPTGSWTRGASEAVKPFSIRTDRLFVSGAPAASGIEFEMARARQSLLARIAKITGLDADVTYDPKTGRITAADLDLTYDPKTGRITAADVDVTYDQKTGRITAADLDLTFDPKTGRITAADLDVTYDLKTGRITAADLDVTYALKTGRITAADLDITYTSTESGIELVLATTRQNLLARAARLSGLDIDLTYATKEARITAADIDLTFSLKTGRITAADLDLTYAEKTGRITAVDIDVVHELKTGRLVAVDADITYALKTGRIAAIDVDVVYFNQLGRIVAMDVDITYTEGATLDTTPVLLARPERHLLRSMLSHREYLRKIIRRNK